MGLLMGGVARGSNVVGTSLNEHGAKISREAIHKLRFITVVFEAGQARHCRGYRAAVTLNCIFRRISSDAAPISSWYSPGSTIYFFLLVSQQLRYFAGI